MMTLRRIEPLKGLFPKGLPKPELGKRPELRWVAPTSLYVDETYQRDIGRRSLNLIRTIVMVFAWRKVKPPIVVEQDGKLHCVDGQHTAIAAATLRLAEIPVFVVEGDSAEVRADSFVAHNRDRITMSPNDVFRGLLAAGNIEAKAVQEVCERAGVRIIGQVQRLGRIRVGDAACVSTIQRLMKRHGARKTRLILEALVAGGRAPITAAEIDACELLITESRNDLTSAQLGAIVQGVGDKGVLQSRMTATQEKRPQKRVLQEAYLAQADRLRSARELA